VNQTLSVFTRQLLDDD